LKQIGYIPIGDVKDLFSENLQETPILDKNCIYYSSSVDSKTGLKTYVLIYEFDPRSVVINFDDGTKKFKTFNIALPYVQFYLKISQDKNGNCIPLSDETYISCTKRPIKALSDQVFSLPMNNIYAEEGNICWGYNPIAKSKDPFVMARTMCNNFFTIPFNDDLVPDPSSIGGYAYWAAQTKANPMFILDANFVPHPAYDVLNILGRMR
jgi:hypothetical protein